MPRTLKILFAVFACLGVIFILVKTASRTGTNNNYLYKDAKRTGRLVIDRAGKSAELVRTGDKWEMRSPFPSGADKAAVEDLLDSLASARLSEPFATEQGKDASFGIAADSPLRLRAFSAASEREPKLDILIGKTGGDYDSTFVRKQSSNEIREARGLSRDKLDREPADWADKTVCRIPQEAVTALEIWEGGKTLALKKQNGEWRCNGSASVSTQAVSQTLQPMLDALADFRADGVSSVADVSSMTLRDLRKPEVKLIVWYSNSTDDSKKKGGRTLELEFAAKGAGGERPLRKNDADGLIYRISDWRLNIFRKKASDFSRF